MLQSFRRAAVAQRLPIRSTSRSFSTRGEGKKPTDDGEADGGEQTSSSKDLGNPITWANPTGGPSMTEKGPKYWRYVYPAGALLIVLGFWWTGRKIKKQEEDDRVARKAKNQSFGFSSPPKM